MFSLVCLCLSTGRGFPCDHYSWNMGPHCTRTPSKVPALPPQHQTWDPSGPSPLLVTSFGHHWRPIQTCSLEDTLHWYWHLGPLKHIQLVGKWTVCILLECFLACNIFTKLEKMKCVRKEIWKSNLAWEENWDCLILYAWSVNCNSSFHVNFISLFAWWTFSHTVAMPNFRLINMD